MSNEINDFISELKKTRDYSGFAPKRHEGKTNKKVEKVESVEHTLTLHSDFTQQAVQQVQEESPKTGIILKEDFTKSQVHSIRLSESAIQADKPKPVKLESGKTNTRANASNREAVAYEPFKMSSAFIDYVSEAHANDSFKFSRKKRNDLDDNIYAILMQLKHHGQIKSVSTLINVILSDFVKNNKEALQTLFATSTNRINV